MGILLFIMISLICMVVQGDLYRKTDKKILKYLPLLVSCLGFIASLVIYLVSYIGTIQSGLLAYGTFALFLMILFGMAIGGCLMGIFASKTTIYYIPALLATFFYGTFSLIDGIGEIHSVVWFVLLCMYSASILLSKDKWYGCLIYTCVGLFLVYMGMQETGQVVKEWPFGVVLIVYSILCGYLSYKHSREELHGTYS